MDLVEQQLKVSAGEALTADVLDASIGGHAIEARIYAESPSKRFAPQPGASTDSFGRKRSTACVSIAASRRGRRSRRDTTQLLAKVIVHASDRASAIERLSEALEATTIEMTGAVGPAETNTAFCRVLIESEPFRAATYDTADAEAIAKALRS